MLSVLLMYFLMASTFTLAKAAIAIIPPLSFVAIRMIVSGVLLLGFLYFFKKESWRSWKSDWWLFLQVILFHIYAVYAFEFWALQWVTSSKACLLYNLTPFITALLMYFLYHERLNKQKIIGLIIGFVGLLPLLDGDTRSVFKISVPDMALLVAVASGAYGWILLKELVVHRGYSSFLVNGVGMIGGGLLAGLTALWVEGFPPQITVAYTEPLVIGPLIFSPFAASLLLVAGYLVALIIIANIVGYNLYAQLLHRYSTTFLALAGSITPLFAGLLGWFFLGEQITGVFLCALTITTLGLAIFYAQELKERSKN